MGINKIVLTLDAGGTNFVFGAIQDGREIVNPIQKPSNAHDFDLCFETLTSGFSEVINNLSEKPAAISFAFPGPADYPKGIIGDLINLPAFKGGVPLGPILENHFQIPVFINNDGDLFAYGEALAGILPQINQELENAGSQKKFKNLVGLTIGTGFGGGIVIDNKLLIGDNSIASEVWLMSNRLNPDFFAEEGISTRAIVDVYSELSGETNTKQLMPVDVYNIAVGKMQGNSGAAKETFISFGRMLGDIVANLLTLIDGIVVIGGGLTGASEIYMPALIQEIKTHHFTSRNGDKLDRLVQMVYNYDDEQERKEFLKYPSKEIKIPGTNHSVFYDSTPRLAVATSRQGASKAIALGAYEFAVNNL